MYLVAAKLQLCQSAFVPWYLNSRLPGANTQEDLMSFAKDLSSDAKIQQALVDAKPMPETIDCICNLHH